MNSFLMCFFIIYFGIGFLCSILFLKFALIDKQFFPNKDITVSDFNVIMLMVVCHFVAGLFGILPLILTIYGDKVIIKGDKND